jgi:hypothetical protein
MKNKRGWSEKGQALILIVGALVALMGFVTLAIDGGMILYDRRSAQNAADAAALAGAYMLSWNYYTDSSTTPADTAGLQTSVETAAGDRAHDNHYGSLDGKVIDIAIYSTESTPYNFPAPPSSIHQVPSTTSEPDYYVQVTITSTVDTSFLHVLYSLLNIDNGPVKNTVTAVAHIEPSPAGPLWGGSALVALAPTACATSSGTGGGIYLSGNNLSNLIGGGMFINSDASCSLSGPGGSYLTYTPSLTDVGGVDTSKVLVGVNFIVSPGPMDTYDANAALSYPPTFDLGGIPSCGSKIGHVDTASGTETAADGTTFTYDRLAYPGYYSSSALKSFPFGKNVWFNDGIYCFQTQSTGHVNFNLNGGSVGGNSVLFFLTGNDPCNFTWNSNTVIKFRGYLMGGTDPHSGILIYVDPLNYQKYSGSYIEGQFILNGTMDSFVQGTFFAPTCSAVLNGTGGNMYQGQVAAYNIVISGNNTFFMNYQENMNYKGIPPIKADLSQ